MNIDFSIIGVTERRYCGDRVVESVRAAAKGGIRTIQLREKGLSDIDFFKTAFTLTKLKEEMDINIFINDRYDIAEAASCDGVHLGNEDLPLYAVRKFYKGCIGKTVKSKDEAIKAQTEGADYIAIGPFYNSNTKPQKILLQKDILPEIKDAISIPIIVIGGITPLNASILFEMGADGIAVSESLFKGNVVKNAKKLIDVTSKYGCN